MSPAQEFACHMRFQQPWMSRAIRDFHDELHRQSEQAHQLAFDVANSDEYDLIENMAILAAELRYKSIYVAWLGREES